jgi:hypothetical protein
MTLLAQLQTANKSAMAQNIAASFITGFIIAAAKQVLPLIDPTSFGASLFHMTQAARNQLWLYNFFDSSFTSAIGVSIGLKLKSAFDGIKADGLVKMVDTTPGAKL